MLASAVLATATRPVQDADSDIANNTLCCMVCTGDCQGCCAHRGVPVLLPGAHGGGDCVQDEVQTLRPSRAAISCRDGETELRVYSRGHVLLVELLAGWALSSRLT